MNLKKLILVNNVAEEYVYVSKQRCKCGGLLQVIGQEFNSFPLPHDILKAECEKCLKKKKFFFDVGNCFEKYDDILYKTEDFKCPKHGTVLKRKPIVWGLVKPGMECGDVIFGGCCVPEEECKYGYACLEPDCGIAYYINSEEELVPIHDEDEEKA